MVPSQRRTRHLGHRLHRLHPHPSLRQLQGTLASQAVGEIPRRQTSTVQQEWQGEKQPARGLHAKLFPVGKPKHIHGFDDQNPRQRRPL